MNLVKLFDMQRQLDAHIEKEHPRQEGEDRLAKKILALQVELGELANCWRGFKYWSHDQEPRIIEYCSSCGGRGVIEYFDPFDEQGYMQDPCEDCEGNGTTGRMPLLEEFADCLHFILSIGLEITEPDMLDLKSWNLTKADNITEQFLCLMADVTDLYNGLYNDVDSKFYDVDSKFYYEFLLLRFIHLGEMLGFSWEEVEEAYIRKNAENHSRQERGY
ncbi:dUTP diphosphatase [Anoxybacillus sp. LAT_38]|uniref:dUTP diphosphatase n=1 Tax=Anoxybacillus sp. LAT_26 TaxID=2862719 RepID=UPI001EEACBDC|nr:dUTP diphosphatase [Anoxybacillus sp. LAT_26]MCG6184263.1 dUTP diphosphatase [Anoxybacillus sp. LAT_26]MCG6198585.1 dUTP diphosphatase [Anoxybacillus sp. LAT_38]